MVRCRYCCSARRSGCPSTNAVVRLTSVSRKSVTWKVVRNRMSPIHGQRRRIRLKLQQAGVAILGPRTPAACPWHSSPVRKPARRCCGAPGVRAPSSQPHHQDGAVAVAGGQDVAAWDGRPLRRRRACSGASIAGSLPIGPSSAGERPDRSRYRRPRSRAPCRPRSRTSSGRGRDSRSSACACCRRAASRAAPLRASPVTRNLLSGLKVARRDASPPIPAIRRSPAMFGNHSVTPL